MKLIPLISLTLLYLVIVLIGISNHELWLDEAQHILLAKNSHSVSELIDNARYEGHPLLWSLLLYALLHAKATIFSVQLFHVLISTACVFLILRYSPFSWFVNVLIVFGYFLLYEYSVLSRNYSLSLLFTLLSVIQICSAKRNYILLFITLGLLFNTHLFSCFVCIGFVAVVWKDLMRQDLRVKIISLSVFTIFVVFCLAHLIPPHDHFLLALNTEPLFSPARYSKMLNSVVLGFLPLPDLEKVNYWSNSFLKDHFYNLSLYLGCILLVIPAIIFFRQRASLLLFYFPACCILVFIYLSPLRVENRHAGFFSVLLFCSAWLSWNKRGQTVKAGRISIAGFIRKIVFGTVLITQFICGLMFYYQDLTHDFSSAKKTAAFINDRIPRSECIALCHFTSGPALSLYAGRSLFYIEPAEQGTFCRWNTNPISINDSVFLSRIDLLLKKQEHFILINNRETKILDLLNKNNSLHLLKDFYVEPLAVFRNSVIMSECYFIYSIRKRTAPC